MKWLILGQALIALTCAQGSSIVFPPFMNCDGTGFAGWNAFNNIQGIGAVAGRHFYRTVGAIAHPWKQCCISKEMPNGCECFDVSPASDFFNLLGLIRPLCPPDLKVKFYYYSKAKPDVGHQIRSYDDTIGKTTFDPSKETKILVHGWGDTPFTDVYKNLRKAVMDAGDFNIIVVDWGNAAGHFDRNIFQSIANVRSVGSMLGHLISTLKNQHKLLLKDAHMICAQLGAQVCGAAGKEVKRMENDIVARISALDAVGVGFEGMSVNARLDKSDAVLVDVIHSDAGPNGTFGLGMTMSYGTVDFRPNGGAFQPGCPVVNYGYFDVILQKPGSMAATCSHYRSIALFVSSIKACKYTDPKNAKCHMGWKATAACKGDVILNTAGKAPFCQV